MRVQITFNDVDPSEIGDIVDAFGDVEVSQHLARQGTYRVFSKWLEDTPSAAASGAIMLGQLDKYLMQRRSVEK